MFYIQQKRKFAHIKTLFKKKKNEERTHLSLLKIIKIKRKIPHLCVLMEIYFVCMSLYPAAAAGSYNIPTYIIHNIHIFYT